LLLRQVWTVARRAASARASIAISPAFQAWADGVSDDYECRSHVLRAATERLLEVGTVMDSSSNNGAGAFQLPHGLTNDMKLNPDAAIYAPFNFVFH
jgi:hypothetical protein